jgi:hypothetical protein
VRDSIKLRCVLAVVIAIALDGCARPVTLNAMLDDMAKRHDLPDSNYDRLWYLGTKDGWHYFKHNRGAWMYEARYKVEAKQLQLSESWPYSDNSDQWGTVERIGSRWHTANKSMQGVWEPQSCPGYWRCVRIRPSP